MHCRPTQKRQAPRLQMSEPAVRQLEQNVHRVPIGTLMARRMAAFHPMQTLDRQRTARYLSRLLFWNVRDNCDFDQRAGLK